jgi:phosphate-selective porin OprO and OprP
MIMIRSAKLFASLVFAVSFFLIPLSTASQDFRLRGRVHMDAFYGINQAEEFSNGFNNRRTRLGAGGSINGNWYGLIDIDFAEGSISPADFMFGRRFANGGSLIFGNFKVPIGLEELYSSNSLLLVERASPSNVLTESRRLGVGYDHYGNNLGFMAMIFGRALGEKNAIVDNSPVGACLRGVVYPELAAGQFHIGSSIVYQDRNSNNLIRYRDRPEARDGKGGLILVDAEIDGVRAVLKNSLEMLYIKGPVLVQGEYFRAFHSIMDADDIALNGFYVQGSFMITGESRPYSRGIPGGISPEADSGAWEVAGRFSYIDLNHQGVAGGLQQNISLGINYYASSRIRFMANVIFVNVDIIDQNPVLGVLRAQFHF